MSYAAIVIGIVGTGYSIYSSEKQRSDKKKAAAKLNAENVRPIYNKPKELSEVTNLLESEVNDTGIQDYATTRLGMNEANGIDAILKAGGKADFATIHNTYGNQLAPLLQTIKANRANNIAALNNAKYLEGKASDTEFQYNKDQPFKDNKQLAAMLKTEEAAARTQTINSAIAGASSIGTMLLKANTGNNKKDPNDDSTKSKEKEDFSVDSPADTKPSKDLILDETKVTGTTTDEKALDKMFDEWMDKMKMNN